MSMIRVTTSNDKERVLNTDYIQGAKKTTKDGTTVVELYLLEYDTPLYVYGMRGDHLWHWLCSQCDYQYTEPILPKKEFPIYQDAQGNEHGEF